MLSKNTFIDQLLSLSARMPIPLTVAQGEAFYRYHQLLLTYNKVMDLTNVTNEDEMIVRHYLDSLSLFNFSRAFENRKSASLIDVGTGAGLPGIPLAIVLPQWHIVLLDAQKKRVDFLQRVIDDLGLDHTKVIHGRAEDFAHNPTYREVFTLSTARAVAPLPVLLEYLLPFTQIGGYALALKGPKAKEEAALSLEAAKTLGGKLYPLLPVTLPQADYNPVIAPCEKKEGTPLKYPRKAGIPTKRPL